MSIKLMQEKVEITRLTNLLNDSANKYYNGLEPTLSDLEYDSLLETLENKENESGIQLPNSPTKRVGFTVLDSIPKKKLPRKMLSLEKVKDDIGALMKWMKGKTCLLTLKLDGLSCMLEYEGGCLIGAYTRGNGIEGSDVTEIVSSLPSVPNYIEGFSGQVIGEMLIRKHSFEVINMKQREKGEDEYANARNLATGTVLSLDTKLGRERCLEFVAFDMFIDNDDSSSQEDKLFTLEEKGFAIPLYDIYAGIEKQVVVEGYLESLKRFADTQGFPIDGIVVGINDILAREKCKPTDKFPTHSIAYKFEDEYEETVLRDIEWSMSRNGVLTPVGIFDTVLLDGTEVSRANIHNVSILRTLEIGIEDTIKVVKANQIIPQIIENMTKSDNYDLPKVCPFCAGELSLEGENSLELVCNNDECSEQQILKINHFLSKDALNAKGVSEKIIRKLISLGEVKTIYDVLDLPSKREHLIKANYPSFGRKSVNNMCDTIEKSCITTLERFLIGLGIDNIGRKVSRDIVEKYPTITEVLGITVEGLRSINGIDAIATGICKDISDSEGHIYELLKRVSIEVPSVSEEKGESLAGMTFVFTGKTDAFKNRKEVESFISSNGGKMAGSVSKNTNYLICNAVETSSKYKKAEELGIEIITDNQLKEMVK